MKVEDVLDKVRTLRKYKIPIKKIEVEVDKKIVNIGIPVKIRSGISYEYVYSTSHETSYLSFWVNVDNVYSYHSLETIVKENERNQELIQKLSKGLKSLEKRVYEEAKKMKIVYSDMIKKLESFLKIEKPPREKLLDMSEELNLLDFPINITEKIIKNDKKFVFEFKGKEGLFFSEYTKLYGNIWKISQERIRFPEYVRWEVPEYEIEIISNAFQKFIESYTDILKRFIKKIENFQTWR